MIWCKASFENHFPSSVCKLFPLQRDLFAFVDATLESSQSDKWLPFAIEFPSEATVSEVLSCHGRRAHLFAARREHEDARGTKRATRKHYALLYGEDTLSQQSRMFLAATKAGLLQIMEQIECKQLHLYEIIRADTACHLYFDVEREADLDPMCTVCDVDSDSLEGENFFALETPGGQVKIGVAQYEAHLNALSLQTPQDLCPLNCAVRADNADTTRVLLRELGTFIAEGCPPCAVTEAPLAIEDVIVLRSTSAGGGNKKFSQHYVVRLKGRAFQSNQEVGVFVRCFVAYLERRSATDAQLHRALFFHDVVKYAMGSDGSRIPFLAKKCIIDLAVYSRNRMMRCAGSCKLGQDSVLRVECYVKDGVLQPPLAQSLPFTETLICSGCGGKTLVRLAPAALGVQQQQQHEHDKREGDKLSWSLTSRPSLSREKGNAETELRIERCFANICGKRCELRNPRSATGRFVLYEVEGTRYCQNIQREHKSNRVYIVVDLDAKVWYQKCFDPDCANFRSHPIPL